MESFNPVHWIEKKVAFIRVGLSKIPGLTCPSGHSVSSGAQRERSTSICKDLKQVEEEGEHTQHQLIIMEVSLDLSNYVLVVPVLLGTALAISSVALCFCYITIRRLKKKTKDVNCTTSATISSDSKGNTHLQVSQQSSNIVEKDCCLTHQNKVNSIKVQHQTISRPVSKHEPYLTSFYATPPECPSGFQKESS